MSVWHSTTQLLAGLPLTVAAYGLGVRLHRWLGGHTLANPVLFAIAGVSAVLRFTGLSFGDYMAGTGLLSAALGPATVALAVPLHTHIRQMRRSAVHLVVAAGLGAAAAAASAAAIAWACGAPEIIVSSLAPKSATTAIALGVSERIGRLPAVTAVLVIASAIGGAMLGGCMLTLVGLREPSARGLAIGVAAQAIGTAHALARDEVEGAYAGLGMTLAGVLTGLLLPTLWQALR